MSCVHCQVKKNFEERHATIKNIASADLEKTKYQFLDKSSTTCKDSAHILLFERCASLVERQSKDITEIKRTLDDEFNKIENEYESQEIWTGLLTIVFLVFTFYSLLKTEEQERQAHDTLRQIKRSERRSRSIIKNIDNDKEAAIQSITDSFTNWKKGKNDDVKNIVNTLFDEKEKELKTEFETWFITFQQEKEEQLTEFDKALDKKAYDRLNDIFDKDIEQKIQNFGEELKRKLDSIDKDAKQQVELFINKLNSQTETFETEPGEVEVQDQGEPNEAENNSNDTTDEKYEIEA